MALANNGFIYTSPHTQGHLRSVLNSIKSALDSIFTTAGEVEAVFSSTSVVGQPVYITATGEAALAENDNTAHAVVAGIVSTAAAAGATGAFITNGHVSAESWTTVLGSADLTPGVIYFLGATAGTITATAPTATGTVVRLGVALTARVLSVQIEPGIFLA